MTVRFAWWLCGMFLALGIGVCGTGVWLWGTVDGEAGSAVLVPGLVLLLFGIFYVRMPYFILTPTELRVPIMRGERARTGIRPQARLDASGTRLTMTVGRRTTTSLPVYRAMARGKDWDGLRAQLDQGNRPDAA
ncbi:hypothetical protein F4561_002096 [Lipingzhangella halophila]|uniref:Uncharacterized protein n=1 Tax=Lipingzhangella halophila TaxID=1783352 RepID=A0A7W7W219_9ACTN|nr:hypothetical protein [Lipingzhangella halophila]MBB4931276.1 hypothetical protein [Lipingzhangella halophila]